MPEMTEMKTYKIPTKNRSKIMMVAFIAKAESNALINAHTAAKRMVFFLPL